MAFQALAGNNLHTASPQRSIPLWQWTRLATSSHYFFAKKQLARTDISKQPPSIG
jgi:hypothetical protein